MWDILLNKGILTVSVVLVIIGITLKHRTGTSNELIALILSATSVVIWSVIGIVAAWGCGVLSVLFGYGVKYGILSAGLSIFVWDVFHGTCKYCKDSKDKEKEKNDEEDIL